ncbi:MAG: M1 family metallopeptidase [Bacteroidia bacterium]|nr:M1 family metallopeptidase [Bacteroidia bacterium]
MRGFIIAGCFLVSHSLGAQSLFEQNKLQTEHIHYLSDPSAAEREHSVDMISMKVDVSFVPEKGIVKGTVTHTFTPIQKKVDTLFFDGPGITINTATLDGQPVKFKTSTTGVILYFDKTLTWDETHVVVFVYEAKPEHGIYFIGWNQPVNPSSPDINYIRKQIWTQGQGIDNRNWIPMYDNMNDKLITETVVTIDSRYKVLSNGKKVLEKKNADGTTTWNYKMEKPHAGYLLMLGIGNYGIKSTKTSRGTGVNFWYYPEFPDRRDITSYKTEKMIEFLEDETGTPYAWGEYSQIMVQNFLYGAMENTSATVFGDFFTTDARGFKDRNYMGVNCHELTHQWFGDLITARSDNDVWMQESFATFYPKLFFGMLDGPDAMKWNFRDEVNQALLQGEKDNFPIRHTQGGVKRLYPKGSAVLGMLRYNLGDEQFKRFIKYYLAKNAFANVEAWDFQKAIKDKLGLNYDWFFDQWIHRGGEPHYKISYKKGSGNTEFTVEQIHKTDGNVRYFKMPVDFAVYYKDGSVSREKKWVVDSQMQVISIPNPGNKEISFALFDENSEVMKKMTFDKSLEELMSQASGAKNMIDRYDAVVAMGKISIDKKEDFLKTRFSAETFKGIRAEIAKQLANTLPTYNSTSTTLTTDNLTGIWKLFAGEKETEVKNALILADTIADKHLAAYLVFIKDSAYSVVENALVKIMENKFVSTITKIDILEQTSLEVGMGKSIRCKWLQYSSGIDISNKDKYIAELTTYSAPIYEFRTRINAMNALKALNVYDNKIILNMAEAAVSNNGRLAAPAVESLKHIKTLPGGEMAISSAVSNTEFEAKLKEKGL